VHVLFGDGREIETASTLAEAGHRVILITNEDIASSPRLQTIKLPRVQASQRAILEGLVMQILAGEVAVSRGIEIEEFVFHNSDTKVETSPEGLRP